MGEGWEGVPSIEKVNSDKECEQIMMSVADIGTTKTQTEWPNEYSVRLSFWENWDSNLTGSNHDPVKPMTYHLILITF